MIRSRWKPRQWIYLAAFIAGCEVIQLLRGDWTWGHTVLTLTGVTGPLSLVPGARPFYLERGSRPVTPEGVDLTP